MNILLIRYFEINLLRFELKKRGVMTKKSKNSYKILTFSDFIFIIILLLSVYFTAASTEIAYKLIGASLIVLSALRLVFSITQSVKIISEHKKFSVNENNATEERKITKEVPKQDKEEIDDEKPEQKATEDIGEEGFRIIDKNGEEEGANDEDSDAIKTSAIKQGGETNDKDTEKKKEAAGGAEKFESQSNEGEEKQKAKDKKKSIDLEPREEFETTILKILDVLKVSTNGTSALFFLHNIGAKELIIESYVSNFEEKIQNKKVIPVGSDLVSKVVNSRAIIIRTDIDEGFRRDAIPYYEGDSEVKSFMGAPVYFDSSVTGVICVDSAEEGAFGEEQGELIKKYSDLLADLLKNYTEKYDLAIDSHTLNFISTFEDLMRNKGASVNSIVESGMDTASKLIPDNDIGAVMYDWERNCWGVIDFRSANGFDLRSEVVDLENSMVAPTLLNGKTILTENLKTGLNRVTKNERKINEGFFASAPIKSRSNIYGAFYAEGDAEPGFSEKDLKLLKILGEKVGAAIEHLEFSKILRESAIYDPTTGLVNTPAFQRKLKEEMQRAKDFDASLSLCLIQIDKYKSLDPEKRSDKSERALLHVVDAARGRLRDYDLFGRADAKVFGVLLINFNINEAKIWAERLRKEIAVNPVNYKSGSFNVTVCIGAAEAVKGESEDEFLENARKALEISKGKTNSVSIFE